MQLSFFPSPPAAAVAEMAFLRLLLPLALSGSTLHLLSLFHVETREREGGTPREGGGGERAVPSPLRLRRTDGAERRQEMEPGEAGIMRSEHFGTGRRRGRARKNQGSSSRAMKVVLAK